MKECILHFYIQQKNYLKRRYHGRNSWTIQP